MTDGLQIDIRGLNKRFGPVQAVHDLSFSVSPGRVTGFLGPNGAGKTTTMRILLGLVRAGSGTATIGGRRYDELPRPIETVGAALEASSFHPGRNAHDHLAGYATAAGLARSRVDEVLELVGLTPVAHRRVRGYSLGMRQRLGLAFALLGDPGVLVLDEPANGLDPEGIRWMRRFLRERAAEGRTVLVSSHVLSEIQQSADEVVIIASGALVYDGSLAGLESGPRVAVASADDTALGVALTAAGGTVEKGEGELVVTGLGAAEVGEAALRAGIALTRLTAGQEGLEQAFLDLVGGAR